MSAADLVALPLDAVLDRLAEIAEAADRLEHERRELAAELTRRHDFGDVDDRVTRNGWSYCWSAGRRSYEFPADVVELEERWKAARESAIAMHRAVEKTGSPYWTIRRTRKEAGS